MKKFLFNKTGIQEIQKMLHALPDPKLASEVASLRLDFRQWLKTKFELTKDELDFLDLLSEQFIAYIAVKASNFLAQRKSINLTVIQLKEKQYDN